MIKFDKLIIELLKRKKNVKPTFFYGITLGVDDSRHAEAGCAPSNREVHGKTGKGVQWREWLACTARSYRYLCFGSYSFSMGRRPRALIKIYVTRTLSIRLGYPIKQTNGILNYRDLGAGEDDDGTDNNKRNDEPCDLMPVFAAITPITGCLRLILNGFIWVEPGFWMVYLKTKQQQQKTFEEVGFGCMRKFGKGIFIYSYFFL